MRTSASLILALAGLLLHPCPADAQALDLAREGRIEHQSQVDRRYSQVAVGPSPRQCSGGLMSAPGTDLVRICLPQFSPAGLPFYLASDQVMEGWGCELTSTAMIATAYRLFPEIVVPFPGRNFRTAFTTTPPDAQVAVSRQSGWSIYWDMTITRPDGFSKGLLDASLSHTGLWLQSLDWPQGAGAVDEGLRVGTFSILILVPDPLKPLQRHAVVAVGYEDVVHDDGGYLVLDPASSPIYSGLVQAGVPLRQVLTWNRPSGDPVTGYVAYALQVLPMQQKGSIEVGMHSPAEILVVAPDGRRVGFDPSLGATVHEIPGATYAQQGSWGTAPVVDPPKVLTLDAPEVGSYTIVATGTGTGPFRLTAHARSAAGETADVEIQGTTTPGQVSSYTLSYRFGADGPPALIAGTNLPPVAVPGPDRLVFVGDAVALDGRRSWDADGSVVAWSWAFSDGTSASGPTVAHAFGAPGRYRVALTVTDDRGGSASSTAEVAVVGHQGVAGDGTNELVSTFGGAQIPAWSDSPSMSGDGRFVVFQSDAWGGPQAQPQIVLRDRLLDTSTSILPSGGGWASAPVLSSSGSHVAFVGAGAGVLVQEIATGAQERVDVATDGSPLNGWAPRISADGRYVAFVAPGPVSGTGVWVRDRLARTTQYASARPVRAPSSSTSLGGSLALSGDGRYLAHMVDTGAFSMGLDLIDRSTGTVVHLAERRAPFFTADGRFLLTMPTVFGRGAAPQCELRDLAAGTSEIVSLSAAGAPANGDSPCFQPVASTDGRYVTFASRANNLIPGDTHPLDAQFDVYLRDRLLGTTELVSASSPGVQGRTAGTPANQPPGGVSTDGRIVAFASNAYDLVAQDLNGLVDVFVRVRSASAPAAPIARASGPYVGWASGSVPSFIDFDASGSLSPAGLPLTASWDFGDGSTATGPAAVALRHAYAAAGAYTVTLTVSDGTLVSAPATTSARVVPALVAPVLAVHPACGRPGDAVTLVVQNLAAAPPAGGWDVSKMGPVEVWSRSIPRGLTFGLSGPGGALPAIELPFTEVARTSEVGYTGRFEWRIPASAPEGALVLTGAGGSASVSVPCPLATEVRDRPVAHAGGPYAATAGQPLALDGSRSTDPRGLPLAYSWEFGDDATGDGVTPRHVYAAPGIYTVSLSLTNGQYVSACGIRSSCRALVNVRAAADTSAPVLAGLPPDQVLEAASAAGATASWPPPTAMDAVDGPVAVSCRPASGSVFPLGSSQVSCSASDAAGNVGTGTFTVTVRDTTPPTLVVAPLVVEATGPGSTRVVFPLPAASDAVSTPVVACLPASPADFPLGRHTVACTATDAAGNVSGASFPVTVSDTTPPQLFLVPPDASVEASGPSGAVFWWSAPFAFDVVDPAPVTACAPSSGSLFPIGRTPVTCTAVDFSANAAATGFVVAVQDTTPPTITRLPGDIVVATGSTAAWEPPLASDLVSGTVPVLCTPPSGSTFPAGTTPVSCTARDGAGNTATGLFSVTVTRAPGAPPVIREARAEPSSLWPPDGRMVPVTVDYEVTGSPRMECSLAVSSSAPSPRRLWKVVDDHRVELRAELAGGGAARTYTVRVRCSNADGSATRDVEVPVSRHRRHGPEREDDDHHRRDRTGGPEEEAHRSDGDRGPRGS